MEKKLSLMHAENKNKFFEESRSIKQTIMSTDDNNLFASLSMVSGNEGELKEEIKGDRDSSDMIV